jgi:signal transduction histidine kinase
LKKGSLESEKLKLIDRAARRMESVIKHLRVFARADESALSAVNLNRVIEDAFIMVKQFLKRYPAVEASLDLKTLPPVTGSAGRLEQVFINLITNAKDAMPEGGVITISTGCVRKGARKYVIATFRDTGTGIPEEFGDRIFDPFFTTKQPGKGTGLGLSISRDIIKDHGGELRVLSTGREGTAFEITLPARA